MVITLKPYNPISKPNWDESSSVNFAFRILTRYGAVLVDFGKLTDVISYSDNLSVDGGSGSWNLKLKATSDNISLLKNIHPGLVCEIFCARSADPLEGVIRDPSKIRRKDTTPELPEFVAPSVTLPEAVGGGSLPISGLNDVQKRNAAAIQRVGKSLGLDANQIAGIIAGAMQESQLGTLNDEIDGFGGKGLFQLTDEPGQPGTWIGKGGIRNIQDYYDPEKNVRAIVEDYRFGEWKEVSRGKSPEETATLFASIVLRPRRVGDKYAAKARQLFPGGNTSIVATQAPSEKVSVSPTGGDPAFAGKVIMQRTGTKNDLGLENLKLTVYDRAGKPISEHTVNSGIASTQTRFGGAFTTQAGSLAPVEFGQYRIGQPVVSGEEGVGRIFIPTDPTFATNRSAIGFHVDANRSTAPGSAGCIVFTTEADFAKFQTALQQSGATTFEFLKTVTTVTTQNGTQTTTSSADQFPDVKPIDDPYLDKCPYLLLRGIIEGYGRDTSNNSVLTISGAGYGKIYEDAQVLVDINSPELQSRAFEIRAATQGPQGIAILVYRLLSQWVENFWGDPTGHEARIRQLPFPPNYLARLNQGGTAWSNLKALSIDGFFHLFTCHTGSLVWEKLCWSSKSQSLINGRNWEDLPIEKIPSWSIVSWNDQLGERGVVNYLRCTQSQAGDSTNLASSIYNLGSIRQYGGPTKREILFPIGPPDREQFYTSEPSRKIRATNITFLALAACEAIRWYDRPVQRCAITMRGDAWIRAHMRVAVTEDWHNLKAKPGEYYIISRSHSIDVANGSWLTDLELVRDRRSRYLGIGVGELPIIKGDKPDITETTKTDPLKDWTRSPIFVTGAAGLGKLQKKPDILKIDPTNGLPTIDVPEINVPLAVDEFLFWDLIKGEWVRFNDPIAYARKEIIPNLDKPPKVPVPVVLPKAGTGALQTGPVATPAGKLPSPFASGIWVGSVYDPAGRINSRGRPHNGVDLFPAREGDDNLLAPSDGVVTVHSNSCPPTPLRGCGSGFGNWITIALSGEWSGWEVLYGHMAKIYVSSGQSVRRGAVVGLMGDSGSSGGPHLHIELRKGGQLVNPMRYLVAPTGTAGPDAGRDYLAGG